ncbi:MAG: ATP-dependent DNA helicase PcrA [Candidatus Abyssobacteria bacterium SURF_17]|uniref:DNA 3'-5' helicase n=1 Tax=Candidatus Abyssobacteria bacterium SURF_17 TaxID=2093361 RepID=A0A419EZI8_9BACT|nr:MAG: ATP-dependent DNA helicase PcrA [Candidatus Abyssubacteria bacterium SURF_17]
MDELLKDLNEPQRLAVTTTEGPVVVIAGAGSGKTRVITYRVAYLVGARRVAPHNILAVTFTNKAAEEMRGRIYKLLGTVKLESWIGTFHAACARILRREADCLGYNRAFSIYDESHQLSLVKHCMKHISLSERDHNPNAILSRISLAKNEMITPEAFACSASDYFDQQVARVYTLYQKGLRENNAMDFDDLLDNALLILKEHPERSEKYRELFKYILVDEFQDTNHVQYELVRELAKEHHNLCVVGDDDQSIYSWRGANIENLFNFEKDFPEATAVFLEENYRSTQLILDAANAVIENNERRKPKKLWTSNKHGEKIVWYGAFNEHDEARYIIQEIGRLKELHRELRNSDCAIFYRTNAQSRVIEDELRRANVPYTVVGSVQFYDRREIKDVIAYLRVIANPKDSVSLRRIINTPPRGIGKTTLERADEFASTMNVSLFEAVGRASEIPSLRADARQSLLTVHAYLSHLVEKKQEVPATELVREIVETSGYAQMLEQDPTFEARARLENLDELLSAAAEFEEAAGDSSLDAFLENVSLKTDIDEWDETRDLITLMTLHTAKGLEFSAVFIAGMEEDLFPHANALASEKGLEEERRLCYVGITRAKKRVILTSADTRMTRGMRNAQQPSRFLDEIPGELLQCIDGTHGERVTDDDYSQEMPAYEGSAFHIGDIVEHSAFGLGRIGAVVGSGEKLKVAVRFFRDNKQRDIIVKFAGLRKR